MDCVNHTGVNATAFCQNCGKPLCAACVRTTPTGQILCEPCAVSWQSFQQPFIAPPAGSPNPVAAAVLGLIPGVGAMYNGQFMKGLIHVVIFAMIISITTHYGLFGLFIPAWVLYQAFEAYHTAVARRDGMPLPDPLGLNEVGNWLNFSGRPHPGPPPVGVPGANPNPPPGAPGGYQTPYAGQGYTPVAGFTGPGYANPDYTNPGYTTPGYPDPGVPPVPPVPPVHWRRREPIGAVILVGIGLILLLNEMGYVAERFLHFLWPLLFIALGVWLIIRRMGDTPAGPVQGDNGPKGGTQ
jgi:TM2 domain-containing membrane protein YozV